MRRLTLVLMVTLSLLLQACGADTQGAIATGIYQTQQISELETAAAAAAQPTSTSAPADTATPAASATDTSTATMTATFTHSAPAATNTNKPDFKWKGTWNVTWNGATYPLNVSISGNNFSASLYDGSLNFTFVGSLSQGGQLASGTWSHENGGTGDFHIQIKTGNLNQFIGNKTDDGSGQPASAFCGARSGTSMPSPCKN